MTRQHELLVELDNEFRREAREREHLIKIIMRNTETALMLLKDYNILLRADGYGYVIKMTPIKGGQTEFYTLSKEVYIGIREQLGI